MINKKYLKNLISKEINGKNDFIFDLCNERIIDSLEIIKLNFKKILILGDNGTKLRKFINQKYINTSVTLYDLKKNNFDLDEWQYECNECCKRFIYKFNYTYRIYRLCINERSPRIL